MERDELLAEKAQVADRLEQQVKERTVELAQSVEELRALGDVSQAVNSTVDLETVLTTIVAKARATYGMDDKIISEIRDTIGTAAGRRMPIQIPAVQNDRSHVLDVIVRAGFRALLVLPLLGAAAPFRDALQRAAMRLRSRPRCSCGGIMPVRSGCMPERRNCARPCNSAPRSSP